MLYQQMKNHGNILEDMLNRLGFPKDTNYPGEEVENRASISNTMQQRAKILSLVLQRQLRSTKEVASTPSLTKRWLGKGAYSGIWRSTFRGAQKLFNCPKVWSRSCTKRERTHNSLKKGKVQQADLEDNGHPILIPVDPPDPSSSSYNPQNHLPSPLSLPRLLFESPSVFLEKKYFLKLAQKSIKGVRNIEAETVTDQMLENSNTLSFITKRRLEAHILGKIEDTSKHNRFCLNFVRKNLNRFIALPCLFDHVVEDPSAFRDDDCLLK